MISDIVSVDLQIIGLTLFYIFFISESSELSENPILKSFEAQGLHYTWQADESIAAIDNSPRYTKRIILCFIYIFFLSGLITAGLVYSAKINHS